MDLIQKYIDAMPVWNAMPTIRDNRLHALVKFIVETCPKLDDSNSSRKTWKVEELIPALKGSNVHEVSSLCDILASEAVLIFANDQVTVWPQYLLNAKKAYYGGKYKEVRDKWIVPLNVASFANVAAAVVTCLVTIFASTGNAEKPSQQEELLKSSLQSQVTIDSLKSSLFLRRIQQQTLTIDSLEKALQAEKAKVVGGKKK